jgi:hypothetical protein
MFLALNMSIDNRGKLTNRLHRGICILTIAGRKHKSCVLPTAGDSLGNVNRKLNVDLFASFEMIFGLSESNPVGELRIIILGHKIRVVGLIEYLIGLNRGCKIKWQAPDIGNRHAALYNLTGNKFDFLSGRTGLHNDIAGLKS